MENKINDEGKKTSTHTCYRYLVPGASPNTWWYSVWFSIKLRAPLRGLLTTPATLAQRIMQLKHVKGAGRRGPWLFGANSELIIMSRGACAERMALRCAVCLLMSRFKGQHV